MKKMAIFLMLPLLLCGCTGQSAQTSVPETTQAAEVSAEDPHALRLTQEENVRKATYENKTAYTDFLAQAEKLYLIPGLKQVLTPQGIAVCPTTGRS